MAWGQARGGRDWGPNWGLWGAGGRVKKKKQLELISWGLAKKEAQALGNQLASCSTPPPGFLSVCVTQGLGPLGAAPNSRRCRRPTDREAPLGEEMCFQAARSQLPNLRDVLPSVHAANQGGKPSLGGHDSSPQGSVSTGLVRRRILNFSIISARQCPPESSAVGRIPCGRNGTRKGG